MFGDCLQFQNVQPVHFLESDIFAGQQIYFGSSCLPAGVPAGQAQARGQMLIVSGKLSRED